jgi:hypothetical protein
VVIIAHPKIADSIETAKQIAAFFEERSIHSAVGFLYNADLRQRASNDEFDLMIAWAAILCYALTHGSQQPSPRPGHQPGHLASHGSAATSGKNSAQAAAGDYWLENG